MPNTGELASVIDQYYALPAEAPLDRRLALLSSAATLVDRAASPQKWAALRGLFADLCQDDDPVGAIGAYCDALTIWRPEADDAPWLHCCLQLQLLVANRCPPGSVDGEVALRHIERVVDAAPALEELFGTLLEYEVFGDPVDNWRKRVKYLERAAQRLSPLPEQLTAWARVNNELALAYAAEPGADFGRAIERRLALHRVVCAALAEGDAPYAQTCLHLGEACLNRTDGSVAENGANARLYLDRAMAAAEKTGDVKRQAMSLILTARCLAYKDIARRPDNLHEALAALDRARSLLGATAAGQLVASLEKSAALAHLDLLHFGEPHHLEPLLAHCDAALAGFVNDTDIDERRIVSQIKAEALFDSGDFERAKACLVDAVAEAEELLGRATSTAGRLERIWSLRDSTARLAFCWFETGDVGAAITALERGKALLWAPSGHQPAAAALVDLVPEGGALLLPIFAAPEGVVIVVTRHGTDVTLTPVPLPHFGLPRVLALQRGEDATRLGGWLEAYCYRNSQPGKFQSKIEEVGRVLDQALWTPIRGALDALGIATGAELVWLPHSASSSLPVQAAWRTDGIERRWIVDDYAIRYAPALKMLGGGSGAMPTAGGRLIVANSTGDLPFSDLEVEWIRQASAESLVLAGEAATLPAVMAALLSSAHVHFATHADFNTDDPFESGIRLTGGERLTLRALLPHLGTQGPRVVVLSACETAVARVTSTADEFLGLPAAFLASGARQVLATQWPVDDLSTALLIGEFYRSYGQPGVSPAESLRRAQCWLRGLTNARLADLLRSLRDTPGTVRGL
ncbi:MAG: CHAT domain-containing protein, partial [Acidobacteriota bacterium]